MSLSQMDASTVLPLSVDCDLEYDIDMSMFPGWDDPDTRAQPALRIHLAESCVCQTTPKMVSDEDDFDVEISTIKNGDFRKDGDDVTQGYIRALKADLFCGIFEDAPSEMNSAYHTPTVRHRANSLQDDYLSNGRTSLTDLLNDPFIIGDMTPSPLTPIYNSSSPSSTIALRDIDFLLLSPTGILQRPKTHHKLKHGKHEDDSESPSTTTRYHYHGDDLFSELYVTFNRGEAKVNKTGDPEEMGFDFIAAVRD